MSSENKDTSNCKIIITPLPFSFSRSPSLPTYTNEPIQWTNFSAKDLIKNSEMWLGGELVSPTYWCSDCNKKHKCWTVNGNLQCYLKAKLKKL